MSYNRLSRPRFAILDPGFEQTICEGVIGVFGKEGFERVDAESSFLETLAFLEVICQEIHASHGSELDRKTAMRLLKTRLNVEQGRMVIFGSLSILTRLAHVEFDMMSQINRLIADHFIEIGIDPTMP